MKGILIAALLGAGLARQRGGVWVALAALTVIAAVALASSRLRD